MKNTRVVAHRGFSQSYPENTLLAFRKAVELDADFVEADVRETKDGQIVVIHDATVDRTTDGEGKVRDLAFEQLKRLDAGRWKGDFKNVSIPSLDELLGFAAGRTGLIIEIKEACTGKVIKLVKKHRMESGVIIGSFDIGCLVRTRGIAPEISTALIAGRLPGDPGTLVEQGIQILNIDYSQFKKGGMELFARRGISTGVWTVDEPGDMLDMIEAGVSFITTNRPDILKKLSGRRSGGAF